MPNENTVPLPVEFLETIRELCVDLENEWGEFVPPQENTLVDEARRLLAWVNEVEAGGHHV